MAGIAAVVAAIFKCSWRSLRSASSLTGNNLVGLIALLMAEEPMDRPSSTAIFYLVIGLLWMVPLSQELNRRIPTIRFRLWPLIWLEKAVIYAINLLVNPLLVIAILFAMLSRDRQLGLGLAEIGAVLPVALLTGRLISPDRFRWSPLRFIPRLPGALGGLVQSQIRELLQLLDFPFACAIAMGGVIYVHFSPKPNPEASAVLGSFVVLIMSTCAQGHVTFDAKGFRIRMRLLPMSGLSMLFAKDAAWMLVTAPLFVLFHPLPAAGSALAALIVGHRTTPEQTIEQKRWSFAVGRLVPQGIIQMITLVIAGLFVHQAGVLAFAAVSTLYVGSLWWSSRQQP